MEITNRWHRLANEQECKEANIAAYQELRRHWDILSIPLGAAQDMEDISPWDVVLGYKAGIGNTKYYVIKTPDAVTDLELKLIADRGSLEYGAQGDRKTISVYITQGS
jgi:hypothetical protein